MGVQLCRMDGKTRERTLINLLVNTPKGTVFIRSVDASSYSKIGDIMYELLSSFIEEIGSSKVIQVVTDSASNNVLAGKNCVLILFIFIIYIYYLYVNIFNR
jgi:hypothetical protein